jgi:N-acetylmuramoyl-L-alanine amidase
MAEPERPAKSLQCPPRWTEMTIRHVVKQGESLRDIAARYGFDASTVYDAPENAALRRSRPNPEVLFPGDVVEVPERTVKQESGSTGQVNAYKCSIPGRVLRLVLKDASHRALANEPYEVQVGGKTVEGSTGADGALEAPVPPRVQSGTLVVRGRFFPLRLGHLNPLREAPDEGMSGLKARLRNLGYYGGPVEGALDDGTRIAIALFQRDHGLTVDGKPNDDTLSTIEREHGS